MITDFLSVNDLSIYEFNSLMDVTEKIKKKPGRYQKELKGKTLAMIFEKPSLRTRMTFEVGMLQLGGQAVYLSPSDIQIGSREPISDIGKNLERWVDGIMIRTFAHKNAEDLAQAAGIPVINALTDLLHPCQAMADFFTLKEKKGSLSSLKLAYIGDGNNVCHSLLLAAAKTGTLLNIATPEGYEPSAEILALAEKEGKGNGFKYSLTTDPRKAARDADAVYTDVWASMGQEAEKESKNKIFRPYQVNSKLMNEAKKNALFMHCLPAHRGEEVTDDVIDSENSVVFDQAENRLHVQKAIMLLLLTNK